jgi:hypothetical protein
VQTLDAGLLARPGELDTVAGVARQHVQVQVGHGLEAGRAVGLQDVMPSGANACWTASAMRRAARISAAASSSLQSSSVGTARLVATITWPSLTWPASMNAKTKSSS